MRRAVTSLSVQPCPVNRDGKVAGVVGSDFSLKTMVDMIKEIDLGGKGTAFLVNKSGQILIHPDAKLVTKTLADAFPSQTPAINGRAGPDRSLPARTSSSASCPSPVCRRSNGISVSSSTAARPSRR